MLAASRQAKAGDTAGARKSLQQALKMDPENSAARSELQKLAPAKDDPKSRANAIDAAFGSH